MILADALATRLGRAWDAPVFIEALARIPGGASRETWRFDAIVAGEHRPLILRRDPGGSIIETERTLEYAAIETVHGILPVPAPVLLDAEGGELDAPFFIMARVEGGAVPSPFASDPYAPHADTIGRQFFGDLGRLAALDPTGTPLAALSPAPAEPWRAALDHWAGVIEADEQHPQPIVRAAIRRLHANPPPPPARASIVHGDYRSGNFLHADGRILAILGDPLEDLGWAMDPLWSHDVAGCVAGMIPHDAALATWSAASGLAVDPRALAWWSLFSAVKGMAIWTTAAKQFVAGGLADPVLGVSGYFVARRHDAILAEQLERFAA